MVATPDEFHHSVLTWLAGTQTTAIVLACAGKAPASAALPTVILDGCVAELSPHRFVDLALAGVRTVAVADGSCPEGREAEARAAVKIVPGGLLVATSDVLPGRARILSVGQVPLARRGILRRTVTPDTVWPSPTPGSSRTARVVASLRAFATQLPDGDLDATPGVPAEAVTLAASGCTACGVCVRACPTQALSLETGRGRATLQHLVGACDGHLTCVGSCPVTALSSSGTAPWDLVLAEPQTLAEVDVATCSRCRGVFPDDGTDLCEVCRARRHDVFGSYLPPAAAALLEQWERQQ